MSNTIADKPTVIFVARQFSRFPAGRFHADGPFSGQAFRERFLIPAMRTGKSFLVELDGTAGFGSSFLEEAFGGLVRAGFQATGILALMKLHSTDESIVEEIQDYIKNARENG